MKQLIINADDLGSDVYRNKGIKRSIEEGVVRSVSILPNGPALLDAIKIIKSLKDITVSAGVHINLSEGKPVLKDLRHIVREDGSFQKKQMALQFFSHVEGEEIIREIEEEIDAQIRTILQYDIDISHMDSHHHIHIMPGVIDIAIKKAKGYGIKWVRIPYEPFNTFKKLKIDEPVSREAQFFSRYAGIARDAIKNEGMGYPDHFIGLYMKGKLTKKLLLEVIEKLEDGVTEMMVHPGFEAPFDPTNPFTCFSTKQRVDELKALIDPDFSHALKSRDVQLKSFTEVVM